MSYCVNCGVELDDSATKCALCSTPVINPNIGSQPKQTETPFSSETHIPQGVKRRFIAYIISVVILIPNIVCFLTNAIFKGGFWSVYVNTTSFLIWVIFVFPFFTKKLRPYLMWALDTVGVAAYVYFFFALQHQSGKDWYFMCALPVIAMVSFMVWVYMLWSKKKRRHWLLKSELIIADIAVGSVVFGALLKNVTSYKSAFDVGMIIFVSCAVLIAFMVYCYSSKHMRRWLSKRFFV